MKTIAHQMWGALKERGHPTTQEIDAIDKATPWQEVEPTWWLEMMSTYRTIAAAGAL